MDALQKAMLEASLTAKTEELESIKDDLYRERDLLACCKQTLDPLPTQKRIQEECEGTIAELLRDERRVARQIESIEAVLGGPSAPGVSERIEPGATQLEGPDQDRQDRSPSDDALMQLMRGRGGSGGPER